MPRPRAAPGQHNPQRFVSWSQATRAALYGHGGFYHQPAGPAAHYRTSVHASALFATAVLRLLRQVDAGLGHPQRIDLVDVGAGRGELLTGVLTQLTGPATGPDPLALADRLRVSAVELAAPPAGPGTTPGAAAPGGPAITWSGELPEQVTGLLVANEWLDNVPVDVAEAGPDGPRCVLVEPATGAESPGGPVGLRDADWLARWWPLVGAASGERAEVGWPRDAAWAGAVRTLRAGLAVAVDYGHLRADRVAGRYAAGTLVGYRNGRAVPAVPNGTVDITAHVAVDACAAAGLDARAQASVLLRQRAALTQLGMRRGLPDVRLARTDPAGYARGLHEAPMVAELVDPAGLGAFWWLAQSVNMALPAALAPLRTGPDQPG